MNYIDPAEWEFPVPNLHHTSSVKNSRTLIFGNRSEKHYDLQAPKSDFHTIFVETVIKKCKKLWRIGIYSEIFKIRSRIFSRTLEYICKDHTVNTLFTFQSGFICFNFFF